MNIYIHKIKIMLVLVFSLVCFAANAELRIKAVPFGHGQTNRNEALFFKRAIEVNGWDWVVRNFILQKFVMGIAIVQQNDMHSLIIHILPKKDVQFFYSVKKVFDKMAESNDTVCLSINVNVDIQELRRDEKHKVDFLYSYLYDCFWNEIKDTAISYTVWIGDFFPYQGQSIKYGDFVWVRILSNDVKEEYERECVDRGFSPYPYRRDASNWRTKEERNLYRHYLEKDYDQIIAQPLPKQSVDTGMTYDKPRKTLFQVLTTKWVNEFGLNKRWWP